jgi:hypothetical protein
LPLLRHLLLEAALILLQDQKRLDTSIEAIFGKTCQMTKTTIERGKINMELPVFTNTQIEHYEKVFLKSSAKQDFENIQQLIKVVPAAANLFCYVTESQFKESFFCGQWLFDYLVENFHDRDKSEIEATCFAFGQKAVHTKEKDMKALLIEVIEEFKNQKPIPSPYELSQKLIKDNSEA